MDRHEHDPNGWDDEQNNGISDAQSDGDDAIEQADDTIDHADEASYHADDEQALAFFEDEEAVEPFVPTDFYPAPSERSKKRARRRARRRVATVVLIVAGVVLLCVGTAFAYTLFNDPGSLFSGAAATPTPATSAQLIDSEQTPVTGLDSPTPSPSPDPYQMVYDQADISMMQNIVNVLVIGVDYAEERETWDGKHDYHADVMMVVAINFDENRVDLISLPRDTYANIPGVKGIYKLNASLNCGGGFEAENGAGFLKTCEACSWMLGGIPINYYYAVTMPAVKQLVDAVGGVDYNLEIDFRMAGRDYSRGPQHFNGQAVLDYLRVRKNVQGSGDWNRVNRQKKMMIALFRSMQEQNLVLKIPDIIASFQGQLYTNCTVSQTAALTAFAYKLDSENIGMYSMSGTLTNIFNWNFCLTDQNNRVEIIKSIYDVDVPKHMDYTADYAHYRWADMIADQYLDTVEGLTEHVSSLLAADDLLPTASPEPTPTPTPEVTLQPTETPFVQPTETPTTPPTTPPTAPPTAAPTTPPPATPTPEPVENPTTEGASHNAANGVSVVRLGSRAFAQTTNGEAVQQYDQYERELFNEYLQSLERLEHAQAVARKEAERYVAGKSNSLKSARQDVSDYASHVKTNALQVAQVFGYSTGRFEWSIRYDLDRKFNEVAVDFR